MSTYEMSINSMFNYEMSFYEMSDLCNWLSMKCPIYEMPFNKMSDL